MWCVQQTGYFSHILKWSLIFTPSVWFILIFGIGYVSGFVIYLLIQFDLKYKHRNQRDWHYTHWLITLPAVIGVNQRFHPKSTPLRMFYLLLVVSMMFAWQILFFSIMWFTQMPIKKLQISTVSEIIDNEYRLTGSSDVLNLILHDERVGFKLFLNQSI